MTSLHSIFHNIKYCKTEDESTSPTSHTMTIKYWKTADDPWYMSYKRPILWLCICKFRKGPWTKNLDNNIVLKIAKLVYDNFITPTTIINWIYDEKWKLWKVKDDENNVASWCVSCKKPAIFDHQLVYNLHCSKCKTKVLRVGKCNRKKCLNSLYDFFCRDCEDRAERERRFMNEMTDI